MGDQVGWKIELPKPPATLRGSSREPSSRISGDPELGLVPGHGRVVPGEPGEHAAFAVEGRGGAEVVAAGEDGDGAGDEVDRDQLVDRLASAGMILADADEAVAMVVERQVGVAEGPRRSHRRRLLADLVVVNALVIEVTEPNAAAAHQARPAAIFMGAGADVEAVRRDIRDGAVGRAADHDVAPVLGGAAFDPVDILAVDGNATQSNAGGHHEVGCERRFPLTERSRARSVHRHSGYQVGG